MQHLTQWRSSCSSEVYNSRWSAIAQKLFYNGYRAGFDWILAVASNGFCKSCSTHAFVQRYLKLHSKEVWGGSSFFRLSLLCQTTLWWCRLPSQCCSLPKWFTHKNMIHARVIHCFPRPWSPNIHFAGGIYAAELKVKQEKTELTEMQSAYNRSFLSKRPRWFHKPLLTRQQTLLLR